MLKNEDILLASILQLALTLAIKYSIKQNILLYDSRAFPPPWPNQAPLTQHSLPTATLATSFFSPLSHHLYFVLAITFCYSHLFPLNHNISLSHLILPSRPQQTYFEWARTFCYSHLFPLKGTVSRDLRWVLLYFNRKLFSRAIVGHHKILILLKGHLTINKKIQHMNGPTILDGLHNSRWGHHICWAYFLSGDILIKPYGIVRTAESRIMLLRFLNFLWQPCF